MTTHATRLLALAILAALLTLLVHVALSPLAHLDFGVVGR